MATEPVSDLVQSFTTGKISRRDFVLRLLAAGLSITAVGAVLEACAGSGSTTTSSTPWAADPKSLSGTVKLYKAPFAANEADLQQPYIDTFKTVCPNVTVQFSQFDWTQATAQMTAALTSGSQDVIYIPVFYGTARGPRTVDPGSGVRRADAGLPAELQDSAQAKCARWDLGWRGVDRRGSGNDPHQPRPVQQGRR